MNIKLVDDTHGYRDYDIDDDLLKRCCPPFKLNKDDMFNVYYEIEENGEIHRRKTGAFYDGISLKTTLMETKKMILKEKSINTKQEKSKYNFIKKGNIVFWHDPEGISDGEYEVISVPEEIEDDSIILIASKSSEAEVFPTELHSV